MWEWGEPCRTGELSWDSTLQQLRFIFWFLSYLNGRRESQRRCIGSQCWAELLSTCGKDTEKSWRLHSSLEWGRDTSTYFTRQILNCTPNGTTDKITKTTLCPGFLVVVIYFHWDFGSHPNPSKDVDHRIIKYVELEGPHLTLGPAQDTLRITLWVWESTIWGLLELEGVWSPLQLVEL